jgi:hypothetical protein
MTTREIGPRSRSLPKLPKAEHALVIQTCFDDALTWNRVKQQMLAPVGPDELRAYVQLVEDTAYKDASLMELMLAASEQGESFIFIADVITMTHADRPLLAVWLGREPGRTFRLVPKALQEAENNLSTASMDFEDFENAAGADGIFRDWK